MELNFLMLGFMLLSILSSDTQATTASQNGGVTGSTQNNTMIQSASSSHSTALDQRGSAMSSSVTATVSPVHLPANSTPANASKSTTSSLSSLLLSSTSDSNPTSTVAGVSQTPTPVGTTSMDTSKQGHSGESTTTFKTPKSSGKSWFEAHRDTTIIIGITGGSVLLVVIVVVVAVVCTYLKKDKPSPKPQRDSYSDVALPKSLAKLYDGKESFRDFAFFRDNYGKENGMNGIQNAKMPRYDSYEMQQFQSLGRCSRLYEGTPEEQQASTEHLYDYYNTLSIKEGRSRHDHDYRIGNGLYRSRYSDHFEGSRDSINSQSIDFVDGRHPYSPEPFAFNNPSFLGEQSYHGSRGNATASRMNTDRLHRDHPHMFRHEHTSTYNGFPYERYSHGRHFKAKRPNGGGDNHLNAVDGITRGRGLHDQHRLSHVSASPYNGPGFPDERDFPGRHIESQRMNRTGDRNRGSYYVTDEESLPYMSRSVKGVEEERRRRTRFEGDVVEVLTAFRGGGDDENIALDPKLEPGVVIIYTGQYHA